MPTKMEGVKKTSELTCKKRITSPSKQMRMPESLSLFLRILYTVPWNEILRKMAKNHLSLDFIMTYDVLTPLKVISKDLRKLKHACDTTRVQDFLQCVFMELGTENALVLGYFKWKLFMFRMSPEDYSNYSDKTVKLAKETAEKEQKLLGLCVEELDPSQLFEDLKNMHLVEEDERKRVDRIPRKQRMEILIGRLAVLKRNEMLNIILFHCKKHGNQYLCSEINAMYGGGTGNSNFTEETVQLNPHLPKVDNSAGPSTDGEKREINQRQIESPYNSVTSAVKETLNCSDDYLNYIQEELEDALFKGNNDQQQNIPQSLKMVCEQAHKCIRNQEEIVQMVLKLTEDL